MNEDKITAEELEQEREQDRQDILKRIRNLRLIDDTLMTVVFKNKKCTELLLKIILNKDDLKVIKCKTQSLLENLEGRSSRLDVLATDSNGKKYNIEVQRSNKGASPKRARYNSSCIDLEYLQKSENPEKLPESYVIFITEKDVLKGGKPLYNIEPVIIQTKTVFQSEQHIIYVNGNIRDETPLGQLMQDFFRKEPKNMNYKVLADEVKIYKYGKGVKDMCTAMERFGREREMRGEKRGEMRGEKKAIVSIALRMILKNRSLEEISEVTGLPVSEVKKLAKEINDKGKIIL